MKLNDPVPEKLRDALRAALDGDENVLYSVRSDLTLDRRFGESCIVVTAAKVAVLDVIVLVF